MFELSVDQLGDFESRLQRAGAPIVDAWLPGLSEDEIRSAFVGVPQLSLPQELVTWWQWRGGVDHAKHKSGELGGLSGHPFWSPFTAATVAADEAGLDAPNLLRWIGGSDPWKFIECNAGSGRVGRIFIEHKSENPKLRWASLGALVTVWTDFLDRGWWTYKRFPTGVYSVAKQELIPTDDPLLWDAA